MKNVNAKVLTAAAALCLLAALPLRADWLVTRDGGKVETRGPWKVQGKRVVFTLKDGTLSSLRLAEVDLDASKKATTEAEEAKVAEEETPAPEPKKSIRTLTDKDFARPEPPPPDPSEAAAAADTQGAPKPVQVASWQQAPQAGGKGVEVSGRVRNTGTDLATAVSVAVRLFNARHEQIAVKQASLDTRALRPGQDTAFRAEFPEVSSFDSAEFDVQSMPLMIRQPDQPPADSSQQQP